MKPVLIIITVAFIAQIFYAYRISVLSQKKHVAAMVMLVSTFNKTIINAKPDSTLLFLFQFSLTQLAGSFAIGIQVKEAGLFSRLLKRRSLIAVGAS